MQWVLLIHNRWKLTVKHPFWRHNVSSKKNFNNILKIHDLEQSGELEVTNQWSALRQNVSYPSPFLPAPPPPTTHTHVSILYPRHLLSLWSLSHEAVSLHHFLKCCTSSLWLAIFVVVKMSCYRFCVRVSFCYYFFVRVTLCYYFCVRVSLCYRFCVRVYLCYRFFVRVTLCYYFFVRVSSSMCLQQKNIDDLQQSGEMDECSCAIVISFVIVSLYACSCAKYFDKSVVMLIIKKNSNVLLFLCTSRPAWANNNWSTRQRKPFGMR